MKPIAIGTVSILALSGAFVAIALAPSKTTEMDNETKDIYAFKANTIDGKSKEFKDYKGKVLVIVNVASKCGLTPQYEGLENLYKSHKSDGLEILGFPANEFAGQEPGSDSEISQFCTKNYGVTFPMFSKIVVKGENTNPIYKWLLAQTDNHNDIEWNFAKFVIGRDGKVIARFSPKTTPDDPKFVETVKLALEAK